MNSSIINNTLSKKDAYLRYDLPRFEQTVKAILNQVSAGVTALNKYINTGSIVTLQGVKYEFSPEEIAEFANDQVMEALLIKNALWNALDAIGYNKQEPDFLAGVSVIEMTANNKKSSTIIPPIT